MGFFEEIFESFGDSFEIFWEIVADFCINISALIRALVHAEYSVAIGAFDTGRNSCILYCRGF